MNKKITKEDVLFLIVVVAVGLGINYFVFPDSPFVQKWIEPGVVGVIAGIYVVYFKK